MTSLNNLTYDYLQAKEPPKREDRLDACNAFGGSLCTLSQKVKCGCLKNSKRSFAQTQGCQLYLTSSILGTMLNSVLIYHGPLGCGSTFISSSGTSTSVQRLRDPNAPGLVWLSTNLDEGDVISGGEAKLAAAIRYADREYRPEAIIVANTCVPAIIGDDIDTVITTLSKEVNAKIVPVHCEGFKSKIMATAYDSLYHGILRTLLTKREEETEPILLDEVEEFKEKLRISRTINLFNVSSISQPDEAELTRLLTALGLNVRLFPCYSKPYSFEDISEAALNVSICSTHDDYFAGHLRELFGTPYINSTLPIGTAGVRKWLLEIADFFGLREVAERHIKVEEARLKEALEPLKQRLRGKRVYLAGGEIRALATAECLHSDLEMEIASVQGYHYDRFADEYIDSNERQGGPSFSAATGQPFEQSNIIRQLKPDIYVGHVSLNGWAGRHGIPTLPIFNVNVNYMGYSGAYDMARRLDRLLKNSRFNRNIAEFNPLPYRESWYSQDPFTYVEER